MLKVIQVELRKSSGNYKKNGIVLCTRRMSEEDCHVKYSGYQISYPVFEANITSILDWFLTPDTIKLFDYGRGNSPSTLEEERRRRLSLVKGMHVEVGDDLSPYMCYPNLHEGDLLDGTKLWLAHQVLFSEKKLSIGYLQGYLSHPNQNFEDWLRNGEKMQYTSAGTKSFLRANEVFFKNMRYLCNSKKQNLSDYVLNEFGYEVTLRLL